MDDGDGIADDVVIADRARTGRIPPHICRAIRRLVEGEIGVRADAERQGGRITRVYMRRMGRRVIEPGGAMIEVLCQRRTRRRKVVCL